MDETQSPHPQTFPQEPLARLAHRALAVTWGTDASYVLGPIALERVGFAHLPMLTMTVQCKAQDIGSTIPICRQAAFAYLAERGVSDEHLAFRPGVGKGSRRHRFTDQFGVSKMGEIHEVHFDLSATLAAGIDWTWNGKGTLKANWELDTSV